jgi:protein O-mannosyl-transferase
MVQMNAKKFFAISSVAIVVLILGFYYRALNLAFLYADDFEGVKAAFLSPYDAIFHNWTVIFFRPVSLLFLFVDRLLYGAVPFGFHLTSLLFHIAVSLTILWLSYILTGEYFVALFAAVLFAVMPVNAETVNWVCCRGDSQITLFMMLALIAYILSKEKHAVSRLSVSMLLFVLALGSKETAVIFPLILICYEWLYQGLKKNQWKLFGYWAVLAGYLAFRSFALHGISLAYHHSSILRTVFSILYLPFKTVQLIFLPFIQTNLYLYFIIDPLIMLALIVFLVWYIRKFKPDKVLYLFILWAFFLLLPISPVAPIGFDFQTSRYWYGPSAGIAMLISYMVFSRRSKWGRYKNIIITGFALFFVYNCYFLIRTNNDWQKASDISLSIKAQAMEIAAKYPKGSNVYFWDLPDNYHGCQIGMPYLEPPFVDTGRHIFGYQFSYQFIGDLKDYKVYTSPNFFYDQDSGTFKKISPRKVKEENIPRLYNDYASKNRLKAFLKEVRGK